MAKYSLKRDFGVGLTRGTTNITSGNGGYLSAAQTPLSWVGGGVCGAKEKLAHRRSVQQPQDRARI